jgi:hypothetical protein
MPFFRKKKMTATGNPKIRMVVTIMLKTDNVDTIATSRSFTGLLYHII